MHTKKNIPSSPSLMNRITYLASVLPIKLSISTKQMLAGCSVSLSHNSTISNGQKGHYFIFFKIYYKNHWCLFYFLLIPPLWFSLFKLLSILDCELTCWELIISSILGISTVPGKKWIKKINKKNTFNLDGWISNFKVIFRVYVFLN